MFAPAIAPPCPALERKKRYPRALQGRVPWRQSRPHPHKALGIICRLTEANPFRPRTSGAHVPRLLREKAVSESLARAGPMAAEPPPPSQGTRHYLSPSGSQPLSPPHIGGTCAPPTERKSGVREPCKGGSRGGKAAPALTRHSALFVA